MHALASILAASDELNVGYTVAGVLFAAWAVVVSIVGLRSETFPKSATQGRAAIMISVVLAASTLGLLIVVSV